MDSFPMRHGTVRYAGYNIMSLSFVCSSEGQSEAVAVKEVCYVGDTPSCHLRHDFSPGQTVMFSAVRDRSSYIPYAWKAVCMWTVQKPPTFFTVSDWESTVANFYKDYWLIKNILNGNAGVEICRVKERGILNSLYLKLKSEFEEQNTIHKWENLYTLLRSYNDLLYVEKTYGSVTNYIQYYCTIFKLSKTGYIYPTRNINILDQYLQKYEDEEEDEEEEGVDWEDEDEEGVDCEDESEDEEDEVGVDCQDESEEEDESQEEDESLEEDVHVNEDTFYNYSPAVMTSEVKVEMDSFPMRHGTVGYVGKNVMFLSFFSKLGEQCQAIAVKDVCYSGDRMSRNLIQDFTIGDKVMFSAVKDHSSNIPDVWKAVCVWTIYKPSPSFKIQEWESTVSRLYSDGSLVMNYGDKCIVIETRILTTIFWRIKSDLGQQLVYKRGDNLDAFLSSPTDSLYIQKIYGSVSKYIVYHCHLFKISRKGRIYPARRPVNCLQNYLDNNLSKLIQEVKDIVEMSDNEDYVEDQEKIQEVVGNQGRLEDESKNCVVEQVQRCEGNERGQDGGIKLAKLEHQDERQKGKITIHEQGLGFKEKNPDNSYASAFESSEPKINLSHIDVVDYFSSRLKQLNIVHICVRSLSSMTLQKLLDDSPKHIKLYINKTYSNLKNFFHFHDCEFSIDHKCTVLRKANERSRKDLTAIDIGSANTTNNLFEIEGYGINDFIRKSSSEDSKCSNDDKSTFVNKNVFENLWTAAVKVPEPTATLEKVDASTQTLSTGPILSMSQCLE